MSAPIALHLSQVQVPIGGEVTGTVEVLQDLPTARAVEVQLEGGVGMAFTRSPPVRVAEGPLVAGQRVEFALEVPPDASPTYLGERVRRDWQVRAAVDGPWALDPAVAAPIDIVPATLPTAQAREAFLARRAAGKAASPAAGLVAKAFGCLLVVVFIVPLVVFLALLSPVFLVLWARDGLVRTRLREFRAEVPEAALLGDALPVEVSFDLRRPIDVDEVTVTLACKEHWVTGGGKSSQHHERTIHEQREVLAGPGVLAPAHRLEPARFRARVVFPLPPEGPPSIGQAPRPDVTWTVTARAWLVGWPDPKEEKRIEVVAATAPAPPAPAPAAAEAASAGVVFVPRGAPAPLGVDVATAGAAVWPWLVLPFVGLAVAAVDVLLRLNGAPDPSVLLGLPPYSLAAAGAGLVALGAAGTTWRMVS
ncbi:MAG: hypothetical protein M9894_30000 [Planctomycetes bacterium]|nr:hypothetical protein [Planctomycetota bacterium]